MDILSILGAIGGLIGTLGSLTAFFYVRQEKDKRELENDSLVIEQYKGLACSQEQERQRLLNVIEHRNAKVNQLEAERDKYLNLWLAERCVVKGCDYRRPPLGSDAPKSDPSLCVR